MDRTAQTVKKVATTIIMAPTAVLEAMADIAVIQPLKRAVGDVKEGVNSEAILQ